MLYKKSAGQGRPVYLLHGWGFNCRVWDDIIQDFQQYWKVTAIDLPGHGKSSLPASVKYNLDTLTAELLPEIEPGASIIGWSLGGVLALNLALQHPKLISTLVLVASSPQFVRCNDWVHGMPANIIEGFATDLTKDYRQTILRFLAIQAMGSDFTRNTLRTLREKIFLNGEPHIKALQGGLEILLSTNLRPQLKKINSDVLFLLGEKDTLVPQSAGAASTALTPNSRYAIIAGAAHAPFVTHPQQFIQLISDFINEH
ncbi:MAG: pimeloyl-ACP methyl ester esterase BioH [Gammaproteobacteria bacterium]|nr:pimeloyl-ACP methyl ester esterase BioH [Gammaproteobacteria bacterium]